MLYNKETVKVVRDIPKPSSSAPSPAALTIGNFDGIHRGHRVLLDAVLKQSRHNNWRCAVMSFEPHPLTVIKKISVCRLYSVTDKIKYLSGLSVDMLYLLRFTPSFAAYSPNEFTSLIFDRLSTRYLAVGENFRYGRQRQGDIITLKKEAKLRGAFVEAIPLQLYEQQPISSGRIRQYLQQDDFDNAAKLLGRTWLISGVVSRGRGLGSQWGIPTANLKLNFQPVCKGIYVGVTKICGRVFPVAVSIGINPTVTATEQISTEAHILDFNGDLYGRRLTLQLLHKLREEQKFDNAKLLRAAIKDDIMRARQWWHNNPRDGIKW